MKNVISKTVAATLIPIAVLTVSSGYSPRQNLNVERVKSELISLKSDHRYG